MKMIRRVKFCHNMGQNPHFTVINEDNLEWDVHLTGSGLTQEQCYDLEVAMLTIFYITAEQRDQALVKEYPGTPVTDQIELRYLHDEDEWSKKRKGVT